MAHARLGYARGMSERVDSSAREEDRRSAPDELADAREPAEPSPLQPSEGLDENELGVDPVEAGVEPPEGWSRETSERVTREREGESLGERLWEEEPDVEPREAKPVAETRTHEIDETVDEVAEEQVADSDEPGPEGIGGPDDVGELEDVGELDDVGARPWP